MHASCTSIGCSRGTLMSNLDYGRWIPWIRAAWAAVGNRNTLVMDGSRRALRASLNVPAMDARVSESVSITIHLT